MSKYSASIIVSAQSEARRAQRDGQTIDRARLRVLKVLNDVNIVNDILKYVYGERPLS